MKDHLKQLSIKIRTLKTRNKSLLSTIKECNREVSSNDSQIKKLEGKIREFEKNKREDVDISEHAMLRYIERAYNINLEDLAKEIQEHPNMKLAGVLGDAKIPIGKGCRAIVKNHRVVTIIGGDKFE